MPNTVPIASVKAMSSITPSAIENGARAGVSKPSNMDLVLYCFQCCQTFFDAMIAGHAFQLRELGSCFGVSG